MKLASEVFFGSNWDGKLMDFDTKFEPSQDDITPAQDPKQSVNENLTRASTDEGTEQSRARQSRANHLKPSEA